MQVKDIMSKQVKTVRANASVMEAAKVMSAHRIGGLVVISGTGAIDGIVTERDIMDDVVAKGINARDIEVKDIMTDKVYVVDSHASLEDAANVMTEYKIKRLPVVDKGVLVGIVTASDLIMHEKELIEKLAEIIGSSPVTGMGG